MLRRTIITALCSVAALGSVSAKAAQVCASSASLISNRKMIAFGFGWVRDRIKDALWASLIAKVKSPFTKKDTTGKTQ